MMEKKRAALHVHLPVLMIALVGVLMLTQSLAPQAPAVAQTIAVGGYGLAVLLFLGFFYGLVRG